LAGAFCASNLPVLRTITIVDSYSGAFLGSHGLDLLISLLISVPYFLFGAD
jgi:hypothetical protein